MGSKIPFRIAWIFSLTVLKQDQGIIFFTLERALDYHMHNEYPNYWSQLYILKLWLLTPWHCSNWWVYEVKALPKCSWCRNSTRYEIRNSSLTHPHTKFSAKPKHSRKCWYWFSLMSGSVISVVKLRKSRNLTLGWDNNKIVW